MIIVEDLPVVALSYNEPNCESNWNQLLKSRKDACRVHKAKGQDLAYELTSKIAHSHNAKKYILIELNTQMNHNFWDLVFEPHEKHTSYVFNNVVFHNGLVYDYNATKILNVNKCLSYPSYSRLGYFHNPNPSPYGITSITYNEQYAFRSAYKEVVKLIRNGSSWCLETLWRWLNIGAHHRHGIYAIVGARFGAYDILSSSHIFDIDNHDYFKAFYIDLNSNPISVVNKYNKYIEDKLGIELFTEFNNIDFHMTVANNYQIISK